MKSFIAVALLISATLAYPQMLGIRSIKSVLGCKSMIVQEYGYIDQCVENHSISAAVDIFKNLSKTYVECKDGFQDLVLCYDDVKALIGNATTLYQLFHDHSLNFAKYYEVCKALWSGLHATAQNCYTDIVTPTSLSAIPDMGAINPDDLKRCGADLKADYSLIKDAIVNHSLADIDSLVTRFSSDFITCQTAYEEVAACGEASVNFIKTVLKLVDDAETKTVNPYTWYEDAKAFFGTLETTIDACKPA